MAGRPDIRRGQRKFELCLIAGVCLLAALVAWTSPTSGDYLPGGQVLGDSNPAPAIWDLARGHLGAYVAQQPLMGLVSLLARIPAALIAHGDRGHPLLEYRLGVVICLFPLALLAAWLSRLHQTRQWRAGCALACVLLIVEASRVAAVTAGHPEEVLTAVLATCAVLAAQRRRPGWAGVWLGLAIGTKPWALLAGVPVLMSLPRGRVKTAATAAAIGGLFAAAALASPGVFLTRAGEVGQVHLVNPYSLWWPISSGTPTALIPARVLPLGLTRTPALLAPILLASAALGCRRRGRRQRLSDPVAMAAALWLLRAVADPHPNDYYFIPFVIATATWEIYSLGRLPVLAVLAAGLITATYALPFDQPAWPNTFLAVWALALGGYLTRRAFGRSSARPRFVHLPAGYFNWGRSPVDLSLDDA